MDAAPFRIVHLTDSHHKVGHPQLARAVEVINALTPQPDLVVHGGDVINGYCDEATRAAQMSQAADILSQLRAETIVTCCNHDTHGETVRGRCFAEQFGDQWVRRFQKGQWGVLAVSGNVDLRGNFPVWAKPGQTTYRVGDLWSLQLLDNTLAEMPDGPKLVFTHKPIVPMRGKPSPQDPDGKAPPSSLDNYAHPEPIRSQLVNVLSRRGAVAHYAGHVHFNAACQVGRIHCVATSATQSYPGEIRLIDCFADRIEHAMLPVPGGYDIWTRWRNTTDPTHPTEREFYLGLECERNFTIELDGHTVGAAADRRQR